MSTDTIRNCQVPLAIATQAQSDRKMMIEWKAANQSKGKSNNGGCHGNKDTLAKTIIICTPLEPDSLVTNKLTPPHNSG